MSRVERMEIFIHDAALKRNHIRLFSRPLLCLFARLWCSQEGGGTHLQRQQQSHKVGVPNGWWRVSIRANKSANIIEETCYKLVIYSNIIEALGLWIPSLNQSHDKEKENKKLLRKDDVCSGCCYKCTLVVSDMSLEYLYGLYH